MLGAAQQEFIVNGMGNGPVSDYLAGSHYDTGFRRPYFNEYGLPAVTINTGRRDANGRMIKEEVLIRDLANNGLTVNGPTSLRKLEWVQLDAVVVRAARQRLRAWGDLAAANSYGGFNAWSKTMLEHETMSDPGMAQVDMDGLSEGTTDAPLYQLQGLPLPITHSDFWFPSRQLAASRETGTPLDTTQGEAAGRRIAEMVEKTLIGATGGGVDGLTYAGGGPFTYGRTPSIYGYTNFPQRVTGSLTVPTGLNAATTLAEVLGMLNAMYLKNFYGPFMLYHSIGWDQYLDNDYILTGGTVATQTLRNRLRAIDNIQDVRRLDFLTTNYTLLLVQMTPEVCRAVNGMDITTIQWETHGGMKLHFKVMCIQVPQLRADYNGNCGIAHYSS